MKSWEHEEASVSIPCAYGVNLNSPGAEVLMPEHNVQPQNTRSRLEDRRFEGCSCFTHHTEQARLCNQQFHSVCPILNLKETGMP